MPNPIRTVSRREAVAIIHGLEDGRFFTVVFRKRTVDEETGKREIRVMNCRQRVKKHLAGGECSYSFGEKGLVPVYDMNARGYRSFPIDGLIEVRVGGEDLMVDQGVTV
jgi:hypothetical protein